jgi:glycosyltransferase involved in cell wall biosynthesis
MRCQVCDMEKEPFVSLVTPVYNGGKYLEECIQSVLAQTYKNWEYTIVNNKSEDNSLDIANKYSMIDQRIKVTTNEVLLPVMENFNNSIQKISKKSIYCKIICADDWIYPEFLSKTVNLAENNLNVGIVTSYRLAGDSVIPEKSMPYRKTVFSGQEIGRMNLLEGPYNIGSPSALLYRSKIVLSKEKFFNEERTSGDTEACYEILMDWDFGFIPQILSYSRLHEKSVTTKVMYLGKNFLDHLYMLKKFGPIFLDTDEFQRKENDLMRSYYRFLGKNPKKLLNKQFRDLQKDYLNQINSRLEWKKVLWGGFFETGRNILDLKSHIKKLMR